MPGWLEDRILIRLEYLNPLIEGIGSETCFSSGNGWIFCMWNFGQEMQMTKGSKTIVSTWNKANKANGASLKRRIHT